MDVVNGKTPSPRDALVNLVIKAINTGSKTMGKARSPRDEGFYVGRVSAFVGSAAVVVELMYGGDYEAARRALMTAVNAVRTSWVREELRDTAKVGEVATAIVNKILEEDW
jgi:hypothetical protein